MLAHGMGPAGELDAKKRSSTRTPKTPFPWARESLAAAGALRSYRTSHFSAMAWRAGVSPPMTQQFWRL